MPAEYWGIPCDPSSPKKPRHRAQCGVPFSIKAASQPSKRSSFLTAGYTSLCFSPPLSLPGQDSNTAGVVCAAQDITERKLAETTLRHKQKELEHLAGRFIAAQEEEHLLKGNLHGSSAPGHGTRISVSLPLEDVS